MTHQKVSIVIEWENVLLSEMDRCRAMMRSLHSQIQELNRPATAPETDDQRRFSFQLIIVYNSTVIGTPFVQGEVNQVFPPSQTGIQLTMAPSSGLRYYELKNFGAQQADGDIVLFLDSDVIPEPGWLKNLLNAFGNPAVEIVCGATYIDPGDLMGKTFALTWIFPVRSNQDNLVQAPRFFANNLAFRRQTFQRFPFPSLKETDRGACGRLATQLREHKIPVYRHNGARVSHPPPNGLKHFIIRGMAQGRDDVLNRRENQGRSWLPRESWRQLNYFVRDVSRSLSSIARHRKTVGLSLSQIPLAIGIAVSYYQLRFSGALLTQLVPHFMKHHFRI